jgi:osmoprotectant transport system ATP-binding protein
MIEFKGVSKTYSGSDRPVVNDLTFNIEDGEICVLVGPSGCGKTTSMRMINRLIEPTAGEILIDGQKNTSMSGTQLRRKIGYAIQQIGLFPHRTIGQNVGTVPGLVGWEKERTSRRVDELLDLVGLAPDQYRDRYPAELSGGQQQRVGVARALAADPPIMLMDEPFGAVDPITRDRLQQEFLHIQEDIKKTIVFVTHDIDEAIKMGDKIAILKEGGILAQYDTPENTLANPASDFVSSFVGTDRVLKRLSLLQVKDMDLDPVNGGGNLPRISDHLTLKDALSEIIGAGSDRGLVIPDGNGGDPRGTLSIDAIRNLSHDAEVANG